MCDRTQDFLLFAQECAPKDPGTVTKYVEPPRSKSAFNVAASDIAKGIQQTSKALSSLAKLVRRQGLFDDPTEEINTLVFRIKQDLGELNTKCDAAQLFIDSQKSGAYATLKQSSSHSLKVVSQLKSELMNATKDFKNVLEIRSTKIKDQQKRKAELTGNGGLTVNLTPNKESSSSSSNMHKISNKNNIMATIPSPYNDILTKADSGIVHGSGYSNGHTSQQLLVVPPATMQYYESREQAVSEVEKTIAELGTLFKRLAGMIAEQSELVDRIDEDVEAAVSNADKAHGVLLNMYDNANSNRALYTKIIAILVFFIVFFMLFLM